MVTYAPLTKETSIKLQRQVLRFAYTRLLWGIRRIKIFDLEKWTKVTNEKLNKILDILNAKGLIVSKNRTDDNWWIALALNDKWIEAAEKASWSKRKIFKESYKNDKDLWLLWRNIILAIFVFILLYLYWRQGIKIENLYDIVDVLKE